MLERTRQVLQVVRLASWIVFISCASYFVIRNAESWSGMSLGERATVLFGTASVALVFFSIFIGVLAVLGWGSLRDEIERRVEGAIQERSKSFETELRLRLADFERATQDQIGRADAATSTKIERLEAELRGRVLSVLGYMMAENCVEPATQKVLDRDRLAQAVWSCRQGYDFLQKVGGHPGAMGLNNLVFYSAVLGADSQRQREELLVGARTLKDDGRKHKVPNLLLTYCAVALRYGSADEQIEACQIAETLAKAAYVSEHERKEAEFYLANFCARLGAAAENTPTAAPQ